MKKTSQITKAYAIFSQGIISTLILIGLGYFIGYKIDSSSSLKGILAVVGAIIGIISFILLVYKANFFDSTSKNKEGDDKIEK